MLKRSVPAPTPVLKLPSPLLQSENQPTAVLAEPVVRLNRAFCPSAVLKLGYAPSGGGLTACVNSESAKQPRAKRATNRGVCKLCVFIGHKVSRQQRQLVEIKNVGAAVLAAMADQGLETPASQRPASTIPAREMLLQQNQSDFCLSELTGSYRSIFEAVRAK